MVKTTNQDNSDYHSDYHRTIVITIGFTIGFTIDLPYYIAMGYTLWLFNIAMENGPFTIGFTKINPI